MTFRRGKHYAELFIGRLYIRWRVCDGKCMNRAAGRDVGHGGAGVPNLSQPPTRSV